jgi:hypothetical protein
MVRWVGRRAGEYYTVFLTVLRIHIILVWIGIWIQIRGSMDPDPDADPAIFIIDLQDANKNIILKKVFLHITF